MTSRLLNAITFIHGETSICWGEEGKQEISPNTAEYFQWLTGLSSFHFRGKDGHFTARREQKGEKSYWYAYRKAKKRQVKRYLGTTADLTPVRLEWRAKQIQEQVNQLPALEKHPRKKPVPKATLRQQIAQLEKTVAEQKARIEELEQEVIALNVKRARETVRHREKLV